MKKLIQRNTSARRKTSEKSSGKTPGKPKRVAEASRRLVDIPADRGAREVHSTTQGSE